MALLTAVPLLACGCSSDGGGSGRQVVTVGVGDAAGTPSALTARLAVQAQAADVSSALTQAGDAARKVIDAVVAAGVTKTDVATSDLQVTPQYASPGIGGGTSTISGYEATESLTVRVQDLTKASKVLGDATTAGGDATRVSSVGFDPIDDPKLQASARDRAFADARSRADQYARLAGAKLGEVLSVSEQPSGSATTPKTFAPRAGAAVPVEPGQQTVRGFCPRPRAR
ncbi:SIMPL domain-containing protein [Tsukamurella soli]|uniref:SIMPL domain-containing protein n=1 Tax=Tsukamurella soli TaxID=644556 RepID=A0ABP8JD19_9ACTN